jgi:hypothetical protein
MGREQVQRDPSGKFRGFGELTCTFHPADVLQPALEDVGGKGVRHIDGRREDPVVDIWKCRELVTYESIKRRARGFKHWCKVCASASRHANNQRQRTQEILHPPYDIYLQRALTPIRLPYLYVYHMLLLSIPLE